MQTLILLQGQALTLCARDLVVLNLNKWWVFQKEALSPGQKLIKHLFTFYIPPLLR